MPCASSSRTISARTSSNDSSWMKRRSKIAVQRSGTAGVCQPPSAWPAWIEFRLRLGWRACGGSTGRGRQRVARARLELILEDPHQPRHLLGGVDRQAGHAAVADAADRGQLEPVHPAMPDAHALGIERLGDDHIALAVAGQPARVAQPGHAGEAAALFVRRRALLDRAVQRDARAADRLDRVDRRGDARLLVARAAAVDAPVAHLGAERIDGPAGAGRHDVVVAVEVERCRARRRRAQACRSR